MPVTKAETAERLRRLAAAVRASDQVTQGDRAARDAAIGEADDAGWGLAEIARETGMSVAHVQRIVMARTAERQAQHRPETD